MFIVTLIYVYYGRNLYNIFNFLSNVRMQTTSITALLPAIATYCSGVLFLSFHTKTAARGKWLSFEADLFTVVLTPSGAILPNCQCS